jgi:hypothetical protein
MAEVVPRNPIARPERSADTVSPTIARVSAIMTAAPSASTLAAAKYSELPDEWRSLS